MSSLKVEVLEIESIIPHPNADRLDIVVLKDRGWNCVVRKGEFFSHDLIVYFPIDSVLPEKLEEYLFPSESKIKLYNHRIRTIKIRGCVSQGLCVPINEIKDFLQTKEQWLVGEDLTSKLGVKKYEPPTAMFHAHSSIKRLTHNNPDFQKYTDIENLNNYKGVFVDLETVVVTEKIHGSNFRCGYVKTHCNTLWKRIKRFFHLLPKYEFVYGSHNVQLQDGYKQYQLYYGADIYWEAVDKYSLQEALDDDEVVYGEIYGYGIQKDYIYDCKPGEHKLVIFDVQVNGKYLNHDDLIKWYKQLLVRYTINPKLTNGCPKLVPILYVGPFNFDFVKGLAQQKSFLNKELDVEGLVIRPVMERNDPRLGRAILKLINPNYLLKDQTEFH